MKAQGIPWWYILFYNSKKGAELEGQIWHSQQMTNDP
jgi:hypothetical protein